jgi:hypothetical protein
MAPPRRLQSGEYEAIIDRAAAASTREELRALRRAVLVAWRDDPRAQQLAEVLFEQEQTLDTSDGARAAASVVWYGHPAGERRIRVRPLVSPAAESQPDA